MSDQSAVSRPRSADEVRRAVPALGRADLRPVDEGSEHSAWWVGGEGVLRLATDADVSVRLRREVALREVIRRRTRLPIPAGTLTGEWAPGLAFTLDTRLDGVSSELRPVTRDGEADLAGLLVALGALPAGELSALDIPREPARDGAPLHERAHDAARRLAADGEFALDRLPLLVAGDGVRPGECVDVLLHNDLKGEHIFVTARGRIGGVIDWADAAWGDPAEDIAGIAISIGAPGAVRTAALAGHGEPTRRRGVYLARADTLVRLSDRLHGTDDSPLDLLRAQLRRAWRPTPLDPAPAGGTARP
ncbi:aminoglycoside phosphotransferase family protein [Streptomyces sp. NPDC055078]